MPPKRFERCTPLVWEPARCNSGWGLHFDLAVARHRRSRASDQARFICSLCPGQHWGMRPFSPPCSSLRISFVKKSSRMISIGRFVRLRHLIIQACVGGFVQRPSASLGPFCASCRVSIGVLATVQDQEFRADPILAQAVSWTARIPVRHSSNRD